MRCNRCHKDVDMLMESPHKGDNRQYCLDCYGILFPPGWTEEIPLTDEDGETWFISREDLDGS